jgi:hypothetical protein
LILLRPLSSLRTADSPFNNHFDDLIGTLECAARGATSVNALKLVESQLRQHTEFPPRYCVDRAVVRSGDRKDWMTAWTEAHSEAHPHPVLVQHGRKERLMRVYCSIEYVGQSAHRLCQQLKSAAVPTLRCCLADQHATFSGVRVNENAIESFLET